MAYAIERIGGWYSRLLSGPWSTRRNRGRFWLEDRILDIAVALEVLYGLKGGELTHNLSTRAAYLLGCGSAGRVDVFEAVQELRGPWPRRLSEITCLRGRRIESIKEDESWRTKHAEGRSATKFWTNSWPGRTRRRRSAAGALIDDLKKAVAERALDAEMEAHLEREGVQDAGNHRNGHNRKRVLTDAGAMDLEVPRDRQGRFEPQLVEKYVRRLPGFDDKVISMYARGMTTREIRVTSGSCTGCRCRRSWSRR